MKRDLPLLRVLALAGTAAVLAGAAGLLLAAALLGSSLAPEQRASAQALLLPHWPVLLLVLAAWTGLAMALAQAVYRRWLAPPARLLEQAQVLLQPERGHGLPADAAAANAVTQGLAQVFNGLVAQRSALQAGVAEQVAQATAAMARERGRLAALMHELQQGVMVCNREGRILLYNRRARLQFQALGGTAGPQFIGLGRSIYAVLDPAQLQQALDQIERRLQRGAEAPAARFVATTRAGQWLRVQVAPVLDAADEVDAVDDVGRQAAAQQTAGTASAGTPQAPSAPSAPSEAVRAVNGFVLMFDNITREAEQESAQAAELHELAQALRAGLGRIELGLQTRVQASDQTPPHAPGAADPQDAWRADLKQALQALGARLQALDRHAAERLATRWPREDLLGADLVAAALLRLQALAAQAGGAGARAGLLEVDDSLWLNVDSHTLLQVLEHLTRRLLVEFEADSTPLRLQLRLQRHADGAWLDLVWPARAMSTETVLGWETEPLRAGTAAGAEAGSPLTARDVLQRHGASLSFERDRLRQQACLRLQLPCIQPPAPTQVSSAGTGALSPPDADPNTTSASAAAERPESYDFDLFQPSPATRALDDCLLRELTCTVFDTETTGLAPTQGDQILQIGAVRVLRGRVLRHEAYEQLVDPQRGIPAATIPIHGITPDMVRGQPVLEAVLPVFHAYAADTVLVAHNAAFDLRFLQLAEARCGGLRFDHPVLDTLLLSAVVHPQQASHRLEHIAERFGVTVLGRHTALGDALVTAQVFVRLLPLLAAQGIHTLGQAREASRQTYYARLKY